MFSLSVLKPSVFSFDNQVVNIYKGGNLFYIKKKQVKALTLPAGNYTVTERPKFIKFYRPNVLYFKKETKTDFEPKKLNVKFGNNPNKCSVSLNSGKVLFDNSFLQYPEYVLLFILEHEKGHFFYNGNGVISEVKCDRFACNNLLKLGYNKSQIYYGFDKSLSNKKTSIYRKRMLMNYLKQNKI